MLQIEREGPAPLDTGPSGASGPLTVATVVPSFRRGSGGHATIVHLMRELRARGHHVSIWLEDSEGRHRREQPRVTKRSFAEFFAADAIELHTDFADWKGADVVLATGWQTVARVQLLAGVRARAYLVQDHEPDFYPASAESAWAADTYRSGLHCIAASPWLADLLQTRYGASTSHFDLAVDDTIYRPDGASRREALVIFYARSATPRRAVPLGLCALEVLAERRPATEIELFGEVPPLRGAVGFRSRHHGILAQPQIAELYRSATVGMVLSLTNPSLVALEMMACGLPCVELASESMLATFGDDGPPLLARASALALYEAVEQLLDDRDRREQLARDGLALAAERSWARAAAQVEQGVRTALER